MKRVSPERPVVTSSSPLARTVLVVLLLGLPLAGRPAAQAEPTVPFKVGEALTFDVSWSNFLTAGTVTLAVKERAARGNRSAYHLVAEGVPTSIVGKLYQLYYKAESFLDTRTLLPSLATIYSDEGGRKRSKSSTFKGNGAVEYQITTSTTSTSTLKVPATAQDPLGAIYVLRALPLKAGLAIPIPVTDSGKAYTMRVNVQGRETLKTGVGTLPAWKVSLQISETGGKPGEAETMTLWISDDARKLPLKLRSELTIGSVQLTLAKVTG